MAGSPTNRIHFTKSRIEGLELPQAGKRETWYDDKCPELAVRITSAGARTFYLIRRVGHRTAWLKLGRYPVMTIEQARGEAVKAQANLNAGRSPMEAKRALRGELTVDELFDRFWDEHASKKRSARDDKQRYRDHIKPKIGKKKLSEVTMDNVKDIAKSMEGGGLVGATINRVKALLRTMYNKAREWKEYNGDNPAGAIAPRREESRVRFLAAGEVRQFFGNLDGVEQHWRDFILLSLMLGQRRANTLAMRWQDIDFVDRSWRLEGEYSKNGKPLFVPLIEDALEILAERKKRAKLDDVYVFPAKSRSGHRENPDKAWRQFRDAAKLSGFTIHDLRRSMGSWQAKEGVSLLSIKRSLGHLSPKTTEIYAILDTDPVRTGMEKGHQAIKDVLRRSRESA